MSKTKARERNIIRRTRADGTPVYDARYVDPRTGKRYAKRFRSLADARKFVVNGHDGADVTERLDVYANGVIARMRLGGILRPNGDRYRAITVDGYQASLDLYVLPHIGGVRLSALRHQDVQDVIDAMDGKAGSTIRNALSALGVVLRQARREGLMQANPARDVSAPGRARRIDAAVEPEMIPRYLAALEPRLRVPWALWFYAGLRMGEGLGLRSADVRDGTIHVKQQLLPGTQGIGPVKTRAGVRVVPVLAPLAAILEQHAADGEYVAERIDRRWLRRLSDKQFADAGLPVITPHQARHTFASMMIAAGVDAKMLSVVLGHESVSTTLDIYGHLFPRSYDAMRAAAERMLGGNGMATETRDPA